MPDNQSRGQRIKRVIKSLCIIGEKYEDIIDDIIPNFYDLLCNASEENDLLGDSVRNNLKWHPANQVSLWCEVQHYVRKKRMSIDRACTHLAKKGFRITYQQRDGLQPMAKEEIISTYAVIKKQYFIINRIIITNRALLIYYNNYVDCFIDEFDESAWGRMQKAFAGKDYFDKIDSNPSSPWFIKFQKLKIHFNKRLCALSK